MRRSRFDWLRLTACGLLLLAAFCLPFVEVGDLLEDVWDDTPGSADVADGVRLVRRPLAAPDTPDSSAAPDVFGVAQSLPLLEPGFGLATGLVLPSVLRPARPSLCPRDIERGPPAPA
jgi:hypothetical protein